VGERREVGRERVRLCEGRVGVEACVADGRVVGSGCGRTLGQKTVKSAAAVAAGRAAGAASSEAVKRRAITKAELGGDQDYQLVGTDKGPTTVTGHS
jgi:hypothetical protein